MISASYTLLSVPFRSAQMAKDTLICLKIVVLSNFTLFFDATSLFLIPKVWLRAFNTCFIKSKKGFLLRAITC
jgi:hypothetical protein